MRALDAFYLKRAAEKRARKGRIRLATWQGARR